MAVTPFTKTQINDLFFNLSTYQGIVVGFLNEDELHKVHEVYDQMWALPLNTCFSRIWQEKRSLSIITRTERRVGTGSTSEVFKVSTGSPLFYAAKFNKEEMTNLEKSFNNCLIRDIKFSTLPRHSNLSSYKGIAFDIYRNVFVPIFELVDGPSLLFVKLPKERYPYVLKVMLDIAKALRALDQTKIVHMDLNDGNIMVTKNKAILIDFDEQGFEFRLPPIYEKAQRSMRSEFARKFIELVAPKIVLNEEYFPFQKEDLMRNLNLAGVTPKVSDLLTDCLDPNIAMNTCSWEIIIHTLEAEA